MDTKLILSTLVILLSINGLVKAQAGQADVQPRELVVREGEAFQFICRTGQPIESCRIEFPTGRGVSLKPNLQGTNTGIEYFGEGFQAGQCGIRLQRADAESNGVFKCSMSTPTSIYDIQGIMRLTVARPPQAPELRMYNRYEEYNENDMLEAVCIVRQGRPAANITWFIGDEPIHNGLQAPVIVSEDARNPDLMSIAQNLTRPVSWRDHGKKLRCVSQHISNMERDQYSEADIQVRFAPQPSERQPVELYGFEEGREGVITHIVAANPQPRLQWRVNGRDIVEGESTDEYEVEQAQPLDVYSKEMGRWEARLRIKRVSSADINKDFRLTATNELGTQIYTIKISTQPAASETDLSSLAVVAIVVAVFLIFVILVLVFFAFRTKRWCFAAGVPARSDKESAGALHSSDTESADHAPATTDVQDTKNKKFKLPAFLAKNKQQTKATTPLDEVKVAPSSDEKKSNDVVYAELDLGTGRKAGEIPTIRREDDKTEYAEIVHTKPAK